MSRWSRPNTLRLTRPACSKTLMCLDDAASETVKGAASSVTRIGPSRREFSICRRAEWLNAANVESKAGSYSTIELNIIPRQVFAESSRDRLRALPAAGHPWPTAPV